MKAHLVVNPRVDGVSIAFVPRPGTIYAFPNQAIVIRQADEGTLPQDDEYLHLSDEMAQALYMELAKHYGNISKDSDALRKDYEHERGRVDKLIDHLIERDS